METTRLGALTPNTQALIAAALVVAFCLGMLLIGNVMHNAYSGQAARDEGRAVTVQGSDNVNVYYTEVHGCGVALLCDN